MNTEKSYIDFLLLLTGDQSLSEKLAAELVESDTDPEGFFAKHREAHFSKRGLNAVHPKQTLLYMLNVLGENNFVFELDWKADAEELNYALKEMSRGVIEEDLISEDDEDDAEGMFELIDIAEELLGEMDYGILHLDIESDSHPIALVTLDKLDILDEMSTDLFYAE